MQRFALGLTAALLTTSPLHAQIYADVETSVGTFTMDLDFVNAPLAVGNFVGLATGSITWIDAKTGTVRTNTPYYTDTIFHRVIANFMNQAGSQGGQGTDGPGYNFLDEFSTSDFSAPYTVAMANSGPQTNGSQFFITTVPTTWLNNKHTVFGTIPADGTENIVEGSIDVIDAINAVPVTVTGGSIPVTPVVINSITIRRIGAPAMAFDELTQDLPVITATEIDITFPGPDTKPTLLVNQAPGTTFHLGLSGDLDSWMLDERFLDGRAEAPLSDYNPVPLQTRFDRHYFNPALTTWPSNADFPDSLEDRVFAATINALRGAVLVFTLDPSGTSGTWTFNEQSGIIIDASLVADGYGASITITTDALIVEDNNENSHNFTTWIFTRAGLDSSTARLISGRQTGKGYTRSGARFSIDGTFTLTR